jgi:hypothetical protein
MGIFRCARRHLLASALLLGCSTTATIRHDRGPPLETRIVGGTPGAILVYAQGRTYALPRHEVRDIDHPGNVHVLVGGMLAAYGIVNIAVGFERCEKAQGFENDAEYGGYCAGVFTPFILGTGMVLWGLVTYVSSTSRANDTSRAEEPVLPQDPRRLPPTQPSVPSQPSIPSQATDGGT